MRALLPLFIIMITSFLSFGQSQKLQTRINASVASSTFKYSNIGVAVVDLETGKTVAGVNQNKVLVPASSQKVITTFAALELLGEDFVYETKIAHDGEVLPDGNLVGNIYIVGSGDPTLGSSRFKGTLNFEDLLENLLDQIKEYGITCIDGDIIADESFLHSFPVCPSWQWNDLGNYYASGAWGLNLNENQYLIAFDKRGAVGRRPRIKYYSPEIPGLQFSNEIVVDSSNTKDNAYIFGGPNNYFKRIVGTIPAGEGNFYIKGSIPDPPLFAAYQLYKKLADADIYSSGYRSIYDPVESKKIKKEDIAIIYSPPLKKILKTANYKSVNLYCESLLKTIAKHKGHTGSGGHGLYEINKFLHKLKVDTKGIHLEDGSGLSARNNISPHGLAIFLQRMTKKKELPELLELLAVGGRNGTVAGMFKGSKAAGNVYAKSGSMNRVLTYTGYIKCKSGRWVSYAVMSNGFSIESKQMRRKLEKVMTNIYLYG
jgi:D-alanyl-D-alanine carboxypeptidase/D-alanyl-D-alanine-endopeptidase (penicillin-binding protein 4)